MAYLRDRLPGLLGSTFLASALCVVTGAAAQARTPDNIGGGLRQLVEAQQGAVAPSSAAASAAAQASTAAAARLAPRLLRDTQNRVLVNIWLDGKRSLASLHQALAGLGVSVSAELPNYRKGVIAAYLPVERAVAAAGLPGVRSIILEHKAELRIGRATTQGLATIHADKLNALGLSGQGVTVAAMSDSFDTAPNSVTRIHAAQDIKHGDLPGPGNPNGDTTPVRVLDEDPAPGTDEGRALLQIIHDIAPKAKLCFASAFTGEVQFAANILKLADKNGPCKADVIDDDVGYSEEPFFSDGVVAQAVDQVKADGVAYFSSAGNDNSGNYSAIFNPVSDADARSTYAGGLVLGNVDTGLTAGGFHNFGTAKDVSIALPIAVPPGDHFLVLQWDDAFYANVPTASYDFLVFDNNGFYHPELSGIDNAYSTGQPVQGVILPNSTGDTLTYSVAIALRPGNAPSFAHHLQMVDFDDGNQVTLLKFANRVAPSLFGHPAAAGAIAVAADLWDNKIGTEYYSSLGPTEIWLDQDNLPLAKPEIRRKPEIAAPDGVDTSFFGSPGFPNDPNPLFFGTSAAAPHAAAVGALLIEAAGGPGRLSPGRLKLLLEQTTQQPHPLRAGVVTADLVSGADDLTLTVAGYLPLDPSQFRFSFKGNPGDTVSRVVIDAAKENISFGDNFDQFLIGRTSMDPSDIHYRNKNGLSPTAAIAFTSGGFKAGDFVDLGFDFDNSELGFQGINAGLLYGARVTATFESGGRTSTVSAVLGGPTGRHYSVADGFGLIDAYAAYRALRAGP